MNAPRAQRSAGLIVTAECNLRPGWQADGLGRRRREPSQHRPGGDRFGKLGRLDAGRIEDGR